MSKNESAFVSLIDDDYNSKIELLGSPSDRCTVELTLSYPRTAPFKKMTFEEQRHLYLRLYGAIKRKYPTTLISDEQTFEISPDGNLHLHSYLVFEFKHIICPSGLLCDIVNYHLTMLPKRAQITWGRAEGHLCASFCRIRIPPICVQFHWHDNARQTAWANYILKCQN